MKWHTAAVIGMALCSGVVLIVTGHSDIVALAFIIAVIGAAS